jgi:hypothetical protein
MPHTNPVKRREYDRVKQRLYRVELKIEVLTRYGPNGQLKCSWPGCQVDDVDMLSLDHVANDGAQERHEGFRASTLYHRVRSKNFPEGYQTLCWNHQWKKQILLNREKY